MQTQSLDSADFHLLFLIQFLYPTRRVSRTVLSYPWASVSPTMLSYPWASVSPTMLSYPWASVNPTMLSYPWASVNPTMLSYPWASVSPTDKLYLFQWNNILNLNLNTYSGTITLAGTAFHCIVPEKQMLSVAAARHIN